MVVKLHNWSRKWRPTPVFLPGKEKAGILYQPNVSLKISVCREKQVERLSVIQSEVSQKEKTK